MRCLRRSANDLRICWVSVLLPAPPRMVGRSASSTLDSCYDTYDACSGDHVLGGFCSRRTFGDSDQKPRFATRKRACGLIFGYSGSDRGSRGEPAPEIRADSMPSCWCPPCRGSFTQGEVKTQGKPHCRSEVFRAADVIKFFFQSLNRQRQD